MKKLKIGIIGFGYVGQAMHYLFKDKNDIKVFDIDESKKTHEKSEVNNSDVVFVCVPTPMNADGSQNLSFIESALKNFNPNTLYVLKSTVLPTTTITLKSEHPQLKIVFNPEFLTESNWQSDMLNPDRVVIGGDYEQIKIIESLYRTVYHDDIPIYLTNSTEAELIKYMANSFLATKVSIMNEFKILSDKLSLNWSDVVNGFISDSRIGGSHTQVPGPDGLKGYGGSCFPKDVNAIILFAKDIEINLSVIEAARNCNLLLRPEKDWEQLKGRSIV